MSGLSYKDQTKVRESIQEYLEKFGMTSLRKISKYVHEQTGIYPAATTVSRLVRDYGYDSPVGEWKWQKVK